MSQLSREARQGSATGDGAFFVLAGLGSYVGIWWLRRPAAWRHNTQRHLASFLMTWWLPGLLIFVGICILIPALARRRRQARRGTGDGGQETSGGSADSGGGGVAALTALAAVAAVLVSLVTGFLTNQASANQLRTQQKADQSQRKLAEQGQLTDRFSTAIDELGSSKLDIRLGGIYALQRIMKDSVTGEDEPAIIDVLSAFIHERAVEGVPPPIDVQVALTVLGNRPHPDKPANRNVRTAGNLTGLDLNGAHLDFANLIGANLTSADLIDVHLHHGYLRRLHLNLVQDAKGADFTDADLRCADLSGADLTGADLTGAHLRGAKTDRGTKLPAGIVVPPPSRSSPKCQPS
jgi:Pentapeptide repeats (8 copies)